ncbi:hypothetical protein D3C75_1255490 [compost metagenome]
MPVNIIDHHAGFGSSQHVGYNLNQLLPVKMMNELRTCNNIGRAIGQFPDIRLHDLHSGLMPE